MAALVPVASVAPSIGQVMTHWPSWNVNRWDSCCTTLSSLAASRGMYRTRGRMRVWPLPSRPGLLGTAMCTVPSCVQLARAPSPKRMLMGLRSGRRGPVKSPRSHVMSRVHPLSMAHPGGL